MNENHGDGWPFAAIDNGDTGSVSRMLDASASEPGEPVVGSTPRDDDDDLPGGHDGLWVVDDYDEDSEGGAVTDRTWWLRSAGDWRRARERIGGYAYLRPADRSLVFTEAEPTASERRRFERW
jgi:hypothetical protein